MPIVTRDQGLLHRHRHELRTGVRLQLPRKAASAVETDLMEKRGRALAIAPSGREVVVPTRPYEIKTVEVTFAAIR